MLWTVLLALLAGMAPAAWGQAATAVPKLDLQKFTAPWFELARLPTRREKQCQGDNMVLYGLRDKKNTFEVVISCVMKGDNWNYWNLSGKLNPDGSGRLKLIRFLIFRTSYWVLAADPQMNWMLVGTPNHKSMRVLSKTPTLPDDVMNGIKTQAAAQGFDVSKLVYVTRHGTQMNPVAGQQASGSDPPTPSDTQSVQPRLHQPSH